MVDETRVADASSLAGAVGWVLLIATGPLGPVREIIALAMLVLVPLGLRLADTPRRDGSRTAWYRAAVLGQPLSVVPAVASLTLSQGLTATALAVPWAVTTVLVAGFGLWRLSQRGPWPLTELPLDAGLVYLAVGGIALLLDRVGFALVFEPIIITLTVVHFHYAGFALPVASGLAGRRSPGGWPGKLLLATSAVIAVGPGIIGLGITFAGFALPMAALVEFVAVAGFTTAVALFSLAVVAGALPRVNGWLPRLLLGVASLSVTVSMGFAVFYGFARMTGGTYFGIHAQAFGRMITYHGRLNAFGFAVPALLGWRLVSPRSEARPPGIPFSGLASDGYVGTNFLDRRGLTTDADVSGMMTSVTDYERPAFDPALVAPAVSRFYERSGDYDLAVDPDWAWPWGVLAPLFRALATRVGQLALPLTPIDGDAVLTGRVVGVDGENEADGTRAWIRSNAHAVSDARRMTYVATYARYDAEGGPFLRVTFPLPGGNVTGILRPEHHDTDEAGLTLSSYPVEGNADDAGLYLVVRGFGVRLPIDETLSVRPSRDDAGSITAVHEVRLFGLRLFTLAYDIRPGDRAQPLSDAATECST